MSCEELSGMYELYAMGALEAEERGEIDEHLGRQCSRCAAGVKRALAMTAAMSSLAPEAMPSRRLRGRVIASVGAVSPRRWWMIGWAAAALCATAAAMLLGVNLVRERSRAETAGGQIQSLRASLRDVSAERDRVRQALDFLDLPDTKVVSFGAEERQPPRGRVLVHPSRGVLLLASNLPPAPAGKTYEMWIIPKGGAPRPAGLFQSTAQGTALFIEGAPLDVAATAAIAVSVEPATGSLAPSTKPIIVAAL